MNPVNTALWHIERHLASDLSLGAIAEQTGVSPHHLTRAFGAAMGVSLMRYVRGRRLTEAARALAAGADDILAVALAAGYESHEAFTRAFRDQFALTPEAVRAARGTDGLTLMEPLHMDQTLRTDLSPPRIVDHPPLLLAGIADRYRCDASAGIPGQWQRFLPQFGRITGQIGRIAYGVNFNGDENGDFDYLCGVEVRDFACVPATLQRLRIAAQRYAVFAHEEHVSTIRRTHHTIWTAWLPTSGYSVVDAPFFERYGERFDGASGLGGVEIWLPVERQA